MNAKNPARRANKSSFDPKEARFFADGKIFFADIYHKAGIQRFFTNIK